MKRNEAYPAKYLAADDVGDGPKAVTITNVTHELMPEGRLKPVVYVSGYPKGIVVNKTNAEVLYRLAGTDDDVDWPGIVVEIHIEMGRRPDGASCEVIRFHIPRPKPKVKQPKMVKTTKAAPKVMKAEDDEAYDELNPPLRRRI